MACSETWLEILSAWHDGEATPAEVGRVSMHVPGCERCQSTLADFRRIRRAFQGAPRAGAQDRPARRRRSGRLLAAAALAAAMLAAIVGAKNLRPETGLAEQLELRHVQAFSRSPACEFHSADPAAVGHWLAENVGYEVQVPAIPDAELLGARRCPLNGGMTASVLYRRRGESVTLFLPRTGSPVAEETERLALEVGGCTVGRLGLTVCAQRGRVVTAETRQTALLALQSR